MHHFALIEPILSHQHLTPRVKNCTGRVKTPPVGILENTPDNTKIYCALQFGLFFFLAGSFHHHVAYRTDC